MKKLILTFIVCAILLCSCSGTAKKKGIIPDDVLDIKFISRVSLTYKNKTYFKFELGDKNPAYRWDYDSSSMSYIGKAKITSEVWNTGGGIGLNEYGDVKAGTDENGDAALLEVYGYAWIPDEYRGSIFDAEFMGLNGGSSKSSYSSPIIEEPFRLNEIADVDHCIPYNCNSDLSKMSGNFFAYDNKAIGMIYKFSIYKSASDNKYYLGCDGDCVTYYLMEIIDSTLLSYLGQ